MTINNKKDILLLLFYSPGRTDQVNEPICGRTRIVKMMFLFKKEVLAHFRKGTEITERNFYDFFPWNFGPFSTEVYDDLTFFLLQSFVDEDAISAEEKLPESEQEWEDWLDSSGANSDETSYTELYEREYKLTSKGVRFVEQTLWAELTSNQKNLLKNFKAKTGTVPLRALVRYVYTQYPEDTVKSIIKDDILGRDY